MYKILKKTDIFAPHETMNNISDVGKFVTQGYALRVRYYLLGVFKPTPIMVSRNNSHNSPIIHQSYDVQRNESGVQYNRFF